MKKHSLTIAGYKAYYKTYFMLRLQEALLNTFGKAPAGSQLQLFIQYISKRFFGAYPAAIKLDITDSCNLRCKMCYAQNRGRDLPYAQILEIFQQLRGLPLRLDLLGGEPLLRKDIDQIIRYAKTYLTLKEIVLYTNGTQATEELTHRLANAGLDKAIVTFISHNPNIHDSFTGTVDSWKKTIAGIKNFKKAGIKTFTFTALHTENIKESKEISRFVITELKAHPLFYQYVPQTKNDPLLADPKMWNKVKHEVLCNYTPHHFSTIQKILTFCGRICLGGYYVLSIKINGDVNPCPFINDLYIGNVFKDNIWNIFANRYSSDRFCEFMTLPKECIDCSYKYLCGGGCKAGNNIVYGNYLNKDCRCLGPWKESIRPENIIDKIPTFF
ncbi:MAG: radical SAM/SPASM domain-containing protein [bacterium]